jgi:hypothetical protein
MLAQFREAHPLDLTVALDPEHAAESRADAADFLVFAIRHAVADHALSDEEVKSLRQVARLLRIREGDLLHHRKADIAELLVQEMERLLEDQTIDSSEALHKVKLQELLGLGYDEFVSITAPQIEKVILDLIRHLDPDAGEAARSVEWFLSRVSALDTVYDLNAEVGSRLASGFLYLLMNPAMPGLIKVGHTTRPTEIRMSELTSATGVPVPFVLVYEISVADALAAESYVHSKLERLGYRVSVNREFFSAPPSLAVELMLEARASIG